ncbi:4a-hydroxytetrahydrobiopterin dehydratase [Galbibacter sp.]|uniref:4a-hydroxytetrahydrobiopterin dehydratase n=1 Tax=Galbibacter sp. TaxID=2918471 RepID=UPI002C34A531|nr:4a-hydroxytetrahydrobiopterin dehydratase [Galbibacter sp.]HLV62983.1 4a-hydroxytetrahydrobiopterin dehydratase [Galbibacter sp.]
MKANPLKTYTEQEIQQRILKFEYWEYNEGYLVTSLDFKNFPDAFATMTRIAFEAERLNHHPDWSNTYNNLSIQLRTHDSNGITDKDFELAAQIEKIIQGS